MPLYKRGKLWWVRFTAPVGQRIRRSTGTEDKAAAQEFHDQLKVELWRIHKLGERPRYTWQEAVIKWLKEKYHKADHNKDIQKLRWMDQYLGGLKLDEITRDVVEKVAQAKRGEASASKANRYLALLRSILRAARDEWEWVDRVPKVRLFSEPKRRTRFLTRAEAAKLIEALPTHLADLAEFTLATGLRKSNATGLCWNQIDRSRNVAWIHADQSKSRKPIAVPLNLSAVAVLDRRAGIHGTFVFTYKDEPLRQASTKAWYRTLEKLEIENFRWHDLRHTWASWHVQSGTNLQELQELGGWSSYSMVLRYAHLSADHLRAAADRIAYDQKIEI